MKKIILFCVVIFSLKATAQTTAQLDSFFTKLYKEEKVYGNVLIAEKGVPVYQKSFGKANLEADKDLDDETIFELASVSKQFTAMGIMLLQKQGKLSYEDSLRKFFPQLPYNNITVRQLLNHTSGLPDYILLFLQHWDESKIANNKDMLDLLEKHKPAIQFKPGEKFAYSNTGYALLASIIEKASGQTFGDYLADHIFKPLKMNKTLVFGRRYEKRKLDNYAYGYVYDGKALKWRLPDDVTETAAMVYSLDGIQGDGTVNSTTGDLLKWDRALYTEQLVSKESLNEAYSPVALPSGKKSSYGFGWFIDPSKQFGTIVSHSGGWPGYATYIERHITNDKTIIILQNRDLRVPSIKKIRDILYGVKEEVIKDRKVD